MATSLTLIEKKIKNLEAQAEKLRKARGSALKRLRQEVQRFGFTTKEVFGESEIDGSVQSLTRSKSKKSAMAGKKVAPKYRDGDKTWSGRGSMPRWLRDALKSGRQLESFLIVKPQAPTASAVATTAVSPKATKTMKPVKKASKTAVKAKPAAKAIAPETKTAPLTKQAPKSVKKATAAAPKAKPVQKPVVTKSTPKAPASKGIANKKAPKASAGNASPAGNSAGNGTPAGADAQTTS